MSGAVGTRCVPVFWVHANNAHELKGDNVLPVGCTRIVDYREWEVLASDYAALQARLKEITEAGQAMRYDFKNDCTCPQCTDSRNEACAAWDAAVEGKG